MLGAMVGVVRNGRTKESKTQGDILEVMTPSENRRALGTVQYNPRVPDRTIYFFRRALKMAIQHTGRAVQYFIHTYLIMEAKNWKSPFSVAIFSEQRTYYLTTLIIP
jgi:hypothetical protein